MAMATLAFDSEPRQRRRVRFDIPTPTPTAATPDSHYKAHHADYVDRFSQLVSQWRMETALSSSLEEKVGHHSFRRIVEMGDAAIPLIIIELKRQPDFLFVALQLITNENPIPADAVGNVRRMIDSWLSWAERDGIE